MINFFSLREIVSFEQDNIESGSNAWGMQTDTHVTPQGWYIRVSDAGWGRPNLVQTRRGDLIVADLGILLRNIEWLHNEEIEIEVGFCEENVGSGEGS